MNWTTEPKMVLIREHSIPKLISSDMKVDVPSQVTLMPNTAILLDSMLQYLFVKVLLVICHV
jgi:hypothetical protein